MTAENELPDRSSDEPPSDVPPTTNAASSNPSDEAAEEFTHEFGFRRAAQKAREFPQTPGVYLMKDSQGRVIYVGKAKSLRSRASSYFLKGAEDEFRLHWLGEICDIDCLECESEVDVLLVESRLI